MGQTALHIRDGISVAILFVAASALADDFVSIPDSPAGRHSVVPAIAASTPEAGRGPKALDEGETTSLAAGDFDRDGEVDLAVGSSTDDGGRITLHPGFGPEHQGARFGEAVITIDLSIKPHWLAAGDFDRDGLLDLVVAERGENAIHLLAGDRRRQLLPAATVELPGAITALSGGEVNRRDGLADLAIAVDSPAGPQLLVFQSAAGALAGRPEIFALPAPASAVVPARLDGAGPIDLAVAAGDELVIIEGRDRTSPRREHAPDLIARDRVHTLSLAGSIEALRATGAGLRGLRAKVADGPWQLVSLSTHGLEVTATDDRSDWRADYRAVLQLRLNRDAVTDFVVAGNGHDGPIALESTTGGAFVVDDAGDAGDLIPGDGDCATFGGTCTLRAAVDEANALPGLDSIGFSIPGAALISPGDELYVTDPAVIDGTSQAGGVVEIDDAAWPPPGIPDCPITVTGGGTTIRGMVFTDVCLYLKGSSGNLVAGNYFGTDPTGSTVASAELLISSDDNVIGGTAVADRNLFGEGILSISSGFAAGTGNVVSGNYLGVGPDGSTSLGVGTCMSISGAPGNTVGGSSAGAGNVISGGLYPKVCSPLHISGSGSTGNLVQGNKVGTDSTGSTALGNLVNGILIDTASDNTIGGTAPGAGNVISGNGVAPHEGHGVYIAGGFATGNVVQGNLIGTDAAGASALANLGHGVFIEFGFGNTVGGADPGAGNLISGNDGDGVYVLGLFEDTSNVIQGNSIGTDLGGSFAIANGDNGIFIETAYGTLIGGSDPGAGNLISGNADDGIEILSSFTDETVVAGNSIGTDAAGSGALTNSGHGVHVISGSMITIGGSSAGAANNIASNGGAGVVVTNFGAFGTEVRITGNSIHSNTGLGIDLYGNGVTPNDLGDGDGGPNELQNYPVLSSATGPTAVVSGSLDSTPGTTFTIEFFAGAACDGSGHGEGERYLGSTIESTDGSGTAGFSATLTGTIADGEAITATAIDPDGNTSEFSACITADVDESHIFSDGFESGDVSAWSLVVP